METKDMIGQTYGYWTVLGEGQTKRDKCGRYKTYLHCRCKCGVERDVLKNHLLTGRSKSCGCYHKERMHETAFVDLVGQRFGRLVVESVYGRKGRCVVWNCKCDCGNTVQAITADLRRGHVKSCGCYHYSRITTHGGVANKERLFSIWMGMRRRCFYQKHHAYNDYGGRGITVCDEWANDYGVFREWAMNNGYDDSLTLDRIDVDGNYEPENCRWITRHDQCRNTRYNRYATINGETKTIADWCEYYKIDKPNRVYDRLRSGWSIEDALFKPPHKGVRPSDGNARTKT